MDVQGRKKSGATDDGSAPVKVGGVYQANPSAVSDGQIVRSLMDAYGKFRVALSIPGSNNDINTYTFADAQSNNVNGLVVAAAGFLFNNSTWDRIRSASAAVLSAFSSLGAQLVAMPGNWTVLNVAAANTQATISKSAGAAGVRHVCTGISASLASGSTAVTVPATPVRVVVRDGATGAGTILWDAYLSVITTAGSCARIDISGLNLVGSAATAMTIEFTAAGGVGSFESVSLAGYDAS